MAASVPLRRILGIDPGYDRCGFAVLSCTAQGREAQLLGSGTLRTSRALSLPQRLHKLGRNIEAVISQWQPDEVAVEQLFYNRNAKTVIEVSQARGVILERAASAGVHVVEYAPTMIKSQLTGSGNAAKTQVAFMVCRLTGMKQAAELDDEMDAIAVALCHGMRMSIPKLMVAGRASL
ncbi:MAG: crossover junction endodeoxyribonuclease RuvC [bacterium]|nr:crossover junction endodeoxyribonuclease RuvC [bacterium]